MRWGTDVEIAQKRVRDSEVKLQKTRELTRVSRSQWELLSQEIATYKAKIERASRGSEEFVDLVKKVNNKSIIFFQNLVVKILSGPDSKFKSS
jgi:hypothetical protein